MRKTFTFTASYQDLDGFSVLWSINFPRTVSASHNAWTCIERGQSEEFLHALRGRTIMVNDMADDDGTSLLLVSDGSWIGRFPQAKIHRYSTL